MKPSNLIVKDILYRRPGMTKVVFEADYGKYVRRGTVVFDTIRSKFISHNKDVELLLSVCETLQQTKRKEVR